jgi:hypothetical protein
MSGCVRLGIPADAQGEEKEKSLAGKKMQEIG